MIPIIFIGIVYLWLSSKTPPRGPVLPVIEAPQSPPVAVIDSVQNDRPDTTMAVAEDSGKTGKTEPAPLVAKVMVKPAEPEPEKPVIPESQPAVPKEKKPEPAPVKIQPAPVVETNTPPVEPRPDTVSVAVEKDSAETVVQNRDSLIALIEDPALLFKMKEYALAARRWDEQKKLSYSRFTIVLMYACSPATIDTVLNVIPYPEDVFILPKTIEEQGCYIICWGDFDTRQAADDQYIFLPSWFAEHGLSPMVRPFFKIDQLTRLTMTRLIMNQQLH